MFWRNLCAVLVLGASLTACSSGPEPLYSWGNYQSALLAYTKNPGETQKFADRLASIIEKAEPKNAVPPGVYAEYGYALLTLDRTPEALEQFGKERERWPESAKLIDGVIRRLTKAQSEPSALPAQSAVGGQAPNQQPVPTPALQPTQPK